MDLATRISSAFKARFGQHPPLTVLTPGRVNLIGEHTDYNGGFVFPFAIDRHIALAASPAPDGQTTLLALDLKDEIDFPADALPPPRPGHWSNYLVGVLSEFRAKGVEVPALRIVFGGDIPSGGGLSSSAALSNSMASAVNHFLGSPFTREELAFISQKSEHHYAGVQCGIMDQFITLMGKRECGLKLDCRSLEYRLIPMRIAPYRFVLCNSKVKHELASSEYNHRRAECEGALAVLKETDPGLRDLRDCTLEQLLGAKPRMSEVQYRRALHQVEENQRVADCEKSLLAGDLVSLGRMMYESHHSLDRNFEVTCPELNSLVELARKHPGVLGARMTGGGFGGNTINLVHEDHIASFAASIRKDYQARHGLEAEVMECAPSDGMVLKESR